MPAFLEEKLRQEYGNNPHAIYGTLNRLALMRGSKITPKGRALERKHAADVRAGTAAPGPRSGSRGRLRALMGRMRAGATSYQQP